MANNYQSFTMAKDTKTRVAYAKYLAKQRRANRAVFIGTLVATLFIAAVSAIALVGAIS